MDKYQVIKSEFSVECNKNRVVILMKQDRAINLPTNFAYGSLAFYIQGANTIKAYMFNISNAWVEVTNYVSLSDII